MSNRRLFFTHLLWLLIALGIVAVSVTGFKILELLKEPVETVAVDRATPLVEIESLKRHVGSIPIISRGFIRPRQQVALAAEIAGRVVGVHPQVFILGRVKKGDVLVRLDDRRAKADLARAESDIKSVKARHALNVTRVKRTQKLRARGAVSQEVLDQHLAERDELSASLAGVESARKNASILLEAMQIVAPFDGQIISRDIEIGAIAGQGQILTELFTPDELEVTVALEEREAALIPNLFSQGQASAEISVEFADRRYIWPASIARVSSHLSEKTRTLDVVVKVHPNVEKILPDSRSPLSSGTPPILVNAWATVMIDGRYSEPLFAIPLEALRENDTVWLVSEGTLNIVPIMRVHEEDRIAYVSIESTPAGVDLDTAQLVTSLLSVPIEGMRVRVVSPLANSTIRQNLEFTSLDRQSVDSLLKIKANLERL